MKVVILGSGLIGLLAKEIFEDAVIIPFGKSRFFYFAPPLADDFIIRSEKIDPFMGPCLRQFFGHLAAAPLIMKRVISLGGQLATDSIAIKQYISKVYEDAPAYAHDLLKTEFATYPMTCHNLYRKLLAKYINALRAEVEVRGIPLKIDPGIVHCDLGTVEYDQIISTIPLDVLLELTGVFQSLSAHDEHCFHITTDALDFEGASQVLVADNPIGFHKVDKVGIYDYIFHNLGSIETPLPYFDAFIAPNRYRIAGETKMPKAIPKSPHAPRIPELKDKFKIDLVGSCAQWDDFMDISSCVWRLLQLKDKP